jgi:hypothetical protein
MKPFRNVIIAAGILIAFFCAGYYTAMKTLGPDPAYWVRKDKYLADVAEREARLAAALEVVAEKDSVIGEKDASIAVRDLEISRLKSAEAVSTGKISSLEEENVTLKADAAAVIAANPSVRRLIENYDAQIAEYKTLVFNLSRRAAEEEMRANDFAAKFVAAAFQRDTWKKQYEDEHALRLFSESLVEENERRLASDKVWKWLGWGVAGGSWIYHSVRRK